MTRNARPRRHFWISVIVRVSLGVGLLGLALWLSRDQIREVASRRPDFGLFALAFVLYFGGVLLAYYRWYWLVRALGLPFRLRDAFRLGMIGTLFNLVIPGAVGGDVVKAAYLLREQSHKGRAIATVVIDRIVGLIGLFLLAAITGAWFWASLGEAIRGVVVAAWIALGVTALILVLCFAIRPHGPLARRLSRGAKGARFVREIHETGLAYRRHPAVVLLGIVGGAMTHLGNVLAFAAVSRALYPAAAVPTLAQNLMIVPLVLFSTAIPLPFSGLGATEGVSRLLFRSVSFEGGAVAMLAFRLLQFAGAGIGAVVYVANRDQVQELRQEAESDAEAQPELSPEPVPALHDR
jgi:uncharacterized membrane protein YbhN (UPF0104 family)